MTEYTLPQVLISPRHKNISLVECFQLAQKLANIADDLSTGLPRLKVVSKKMLEVVEHDSEKMVRNGLEPPYHNLHHIADAVLSMGYFLGHSHGLSSYEKQRLILVMLVHDFGHRGISNQLPWLSHEMESIELLKATPLMTLPPEDVLFIQECILGTMPQNVPVVSREYQKNSLNSFNFMRALVNDADIAASFIPSLGWELSKRILLEKGFGNPTQYEIEEALNAFKANAHISTPVAQEALGVVGS
jgi:hypothetical protein